jgi:hypothetical protein
MSPLVGIAIVPVTLPVGAGLIPGDASSVAPSGIPVAPTDSPAPIPSGEVPPTEGIAASGFPTWANAELQNKDHTVVRIKKRLMNDFLDGAEQRQRISWKNRRWTNRLEPRGVTGYQRVSQSMVGSEGRYCRSAKRRGMATNFEFRI